VGRRECLTRLDATLRAGKAGAVVVYHLDRLARNAAALLDGWSGRDDEISNTSSAGVNGHPRRATQGHPC
jgi:hypothetical protein